VLASVLCNRLLKLLKPQEKLFVMKLSRIISAVAFFSIITLSVTAQNNHSLRDENRRIRNGRIRGELTASETARLKIQESRLRAEAYRYKHNDGRISFQERADLRRDNRRLSRNIFHQKHDTQIRF
jgi:hypothetical protein